jgi:conjugal transfer ATP-binding protein TraC
MLSLKFGEIFGGISDQLNRAKRIRAPGIDFNEFSATQLASWLPYSSYKEDDNLFVNLDSLGFVLEISPQTGATEEMAQILVSLFTSCPKNSGIQVTLFGSPHIDDIMRAYGNLRIVDERTETYSSPYGRTERNANAYRTMARRRVDFLKKAARHSLAPTVGSLIRNYRCIFSVNVPGSADDLVLRDAVVLMRTGMKATLRAAGFPNREWGPADLINWCATFLNPQRLYNEGVRIEYDEYKDIRDQIIDRDTHTSIRSDRIVSWKQDQDDHIATRVYCVKSYPKSFALWSMSTLIGDIYQGTLQYGCPFMITMGLFFKDRDAVKNITQMKQARATQNAESPLAKFMPQFQGQKEDWDMALKALDAGDTLVDMYHTVALFSTNEMVQREEQTVRSIWATKGFDLNLIEKIQLPGVMMHLPMAFSAEFYKDLALFKLISTKTSKNAVHLAPLIAEWAGTPTPTMVLAGRRGQVITYDFFDNTAGNYNVAIAGASGSGKSVYVNDIASSYRSIGGRVWIIDVGRSYKNICEAFEGDFIEFSQESNIRINPFTFVVDIKEEMELLQPLISAMASPRGELDNYSYAVIAQAIQRVWDQKGNEASITDIYELVKSGKVDDDMQPDQRIMDLAALLYNYTKYGSYGVYFDGPANLNFTNKFTVLELEELNAKKDLRSVILFIVMFRITYDMYLSDRAQRKIVIIDEAWDLLGAAGGDSSSSAKFIDAGYRRARKYGGSFITATQNITDYNLSPAASSALKNSDWRSYLRQKAESLEALKGQTDDPGFLRALQGLRTEKDVFSEVLISGPGFRCVARCYIDPYNLLRSSSNPVDFTAVSVRRQQGMSLDEALMDVLKERGLA